MNKLVKRTTIEVQGARVNNLKNINLHIHHNSFVVVTGLSGSGKSSLAFDTLYAEGQRRYVESLSSYARQFLGRMNKPEVDLIKGLPPAIAIEQKVNSRNPRSTVGTSTEIYDYLKLLFARIGKTYSPNTGALVEKQTVNDVVRAVMAFPNESRLLLLAPYPDFRQLSEKQLLTDLKHIGVARVKLDGEILKTNELDEEHLKPASSLDLVVDRIVLNDTDDELESRLADSIEYAYQLGNGTCSIEDISGNNAHERYSFSNLFELDGTAYEEPSIHMFSFNNPLGACPRCEGYGRVIGIDEDLVIPDQTLSVYEDAIVCWKGEKMSEWKDELVYNASKFNFPIHKPIIKLTDEEKQLLWDGNDYFHGLNDFFEYLESNKYKIQYRVMLSRYRGKTVCPMCKGTRLKPESGYVKINGANLQQLVQMPVEELRELVNNWIFTPYEQEIAGRLITEVQNRIDYLCDVGLGYLTLNRVSSSLSGGESQRINLATILGSSLVGSLYVLDEPSIGLHPRDTHRLIKVLKKLQQNQNTILVVEHEEEIMHAADEIIDIGPKAGRHGGQVVYNGTYNDFIEHSDGLTAQYLKGTSFIEIPSSRRKWTDYIEIIGAYENNLKGIDVKFPLNILTVVTGVSGSGKSTLVKTILFPALQRLIMGYGDKGGRFSQLNGDYDRINHIEFVDQNPIGKSSRSNPVTYIKAYDEIRKLYAAQPQSSMNGFKPAHFSFNVDGGRCDECQGEGVIKVEMQFMADIVLPCEHCHGKRFKDAVLDVHYRGKSIHDVLELTINEAIEFFGEKQGSTEKKIIQRLSPLAEVGLGYVKLGQSSTTLSGGESQRVKLASFLVSENTPRTMFIFDEPTTGLHFHDIKKLMHSMNRLVEMGHTILIIEHNQEVIKCADWVIDLGPEGGIAGGEVVYQGTPEGLMDEPRSYTGRFLKKKLNLD